MRVVSVLFAVLFLSVSSVSWAGLATDVDADKIRATLKTRYYWSDGKTVVEAQCKNREPISLKNCDEEVAKRKVLWLKDALAGIEKLLPIRLKYDYQVKKADELIAHLEAQIKLREATGNPEKSVELKDKLVVAKEQKDALVAPKSVLKEFEDVLTTDPNLIVTVGENSYPNAEKNSDLLPIVFHLVAPEGVKASWCQKTSRDGRKLWYMLSDRHTRYKAEYDCEKLGGRLPTPEDMKGPNNATIYEIDKHHQWHCPSLAKSAVGKALPVFSANGEDVRMMWLTDNNGDFRATVRASMIGTEGHPCKFNSAHKVNTGTEMGGVCVVERHNHFDGEFQSYTLAELPCQ